jgi:hypothetical protein
MVTNQYDDGPQSPEGHGRQLRSSPCLPSLPLQRSAPLLCVNILSIRKLEWLQTSMMTGLDLLKITGGSCVFLPLACLRFLCSDLRLYYVSIYFL